MKVLIAVLSFLGIIVGTAVIICILIISCLSFQMIIYILDKRKLYSYTCTMFNLCKFELKYQNHKLAVNEINILDIITVFLSFV